MLSFFKIRETCVVQEKGYVVKVSEAAGVTDENLRGAKDFTAICIFVNKKIEARQVCRDCEINNHGPF